MAKKFLDLSGLSDFKRNLFETFSKIGHTHTKSEISDLVIDSSLSIESSNPVQNKMVTSAINTLADQVCYIEYDEAATAALIDLLPSAEEVEF